MAQITRGKKEQIIEIEIQEVGSGTRLNN